MNFTGKVGRYGKDQDGISYEANLEEIRVCGELIEKLTGVHTELFAPPSGAYGEDTVRAAAEAGVDAISIGALTHSVKAADLSLEIRA